MTTLESSQDDPLVPLLWELKAAWKAATGDDVMLTDLMIDRAALERFLASASKATHPKVREVLARIEALRGGATSAKSAAPVAATVAGTAGRAAAAAPAKSGLDLVRTGAVVVASVLLSLAAARSLMTEPAPAPTAPAPAVQSPAAEKSAAPSIAAPTATAAAAPAPAVPATTAPVAHDVVLRIHGSNTVGEKLSPALVEAWLRAKGAPEVRIVGAKAEERTLVAALPGSDRPVGVEVHAHGSSTAFADLLSGSAQVGQSSRRIKKDEIESLKARYGDLSQPATEHVLGLDGVAVIVHPNNRIASLSVPDVARLFSGDIKDWSELGGAPGPVGLYARDDKSGTWDTFRSLVLGPGKLALAASARRFESSSDLADAVAADPNGIGFVGLPYVRRAKLLAIAPERDAAALVPTAFTIGTEDYALSRRLYLYAPASAGSEQAADLIDFALSDRGQEIVKELGFVSQNVVLETLAADPSAPSAYRTATAGAQRLSVNFRFESGGETLDTKAVRDVDRVVRFLARQPGRTVMLYGFTDDRGSASSNEALSKRRADVVADALRSRGVLARETRGFGKAMPVASNASDDGRNHNRRVEVWVR